MSVRGSEGRLRPSRAAVSVLVGLLVAAGMASPRGLSAQEGGRRVEGGIWFAGSVPQGEFDQFVDFGYGLGVHLAVPLTRPGWFRVRLEGANVIYGSETREVPLSRTVGRVRVDVTTRNNIAMFGAGPELVLPAGRLRPYVNGLVGGSVLFTESTVEGDDDFFGSRPFARDVNFSDLAFSVMPGGGLGILLGSSRRAPRLDLGVQYRFQGDARYLQEGGIVEDPDGTVTFDPVESDTDLLLIRAGLSLSL